ncbi:NAD(P)H-dependent oxidoreductase subunit E [Halanaerobaculum tunisiense]
MKKIVVCVGSSCHLKGAPQVIEKLKQLVNNYEELEIDLSASFCTGKCTEGCKSGVVVKFDDQVVTNVTPDNITDIFKSQLKGEI